MQTTRNETLPKRCFCRKLVLSKSEYRNGDTITCGLFDDRVYAVLLHLHYYMFYVTDVTLFLAQIIFAEAW